MHTGGWVFFIDHVNYIYDQLFIRIELNYKDQLVFASSQSQFNVFNWKF